MIGEGLLPGMLVMPRPLALNLVGIMLGESGAQEDHELTVVEEELADYFLVNHWLPYFRESWPGPTPPAFRLQQRETQPRFSRMFAPVDVLVSLHWHMRGPFGDAKGQWLFPRQPLIQALSREPATAPAAADEKEVADTQGPNRPHLAAVARVHSGHGPAQALGVIAACRSATCCCSTANGPWRDRLSPAGRHLFRGQAGRTGAWKAFRIDSFIEK